jgi:hypothetical protein
MRLEAQSYIPRRADSELYEALRQGEFCSVLTPSQMGKSSLMARTAARLAAEGAAVVRIDLTGVGENLEPEQWYFSLLWRIGQDLRLWTELRTFWQEHKALGPLHRWMEAVRTGVLTHCPGQVVIFIDEIGVVSKLPFATDEFFAAVRECYNRRASQPELSRLTFCLLGVATPTELLRDPNTAAFNIGRRIDLYDFDEAEAEPLASGLGRGRGLAQRLLRRVLHWTGGQPYLTQQLCRAVAEDATVRTPRGVDRVCSRLFFSHESRGQDTNIREVERQVLRRDPDLRGVIDLYRRVRGRWFAEVAHDERDPAATALRISGVTRVCDGKQTVRNRIYYRVFDRNWIRSHTPDTELRLRKKAFHQGFLVAIAVSSLIVGVASYAVYIQLDRNYYRTLEEQAKENEQLAQARATEAKENERLAQESAAEAKENERLAQYGKQRLKDVIAEVRDGIDSLIAEVPIEVRNDRRVGFLVSNPMIAFFQEVVLRKAIAHYKQTADKYPEVSELRSDLAKMHHRLAGLSTLNREEALEHYQTAVTLESEVLKLLDNLEKEHRRSLSQYCRDLAAAQRDAGDLEGAVATIARRTALWPDEPNELYAAAVELAMCAAKAQPETTRLLAGQAIDLLRKAGLKGTLDAAALEANSDLAPLRSHDEFRGLLDSLGRGRR